MNKKSISKLITTVEHLILKWLKPAPRLPRKVTKWIAENIWWLSAISMILAIIGAFLVLMAIFAYMTFVGNTSSYLGIYSVQVYSSLWLLGAFSSIAFLIATAYLLSKAYAPLKLMQARGWRLLFIVLLIGAVSAVVSALVSLNVFDIMFSLIFSAIGLAVSAYFLFEIRSHFIKETK